MKTLNSRFLIVCLTLVVGLSALSARLVFLQLIDCEEFAEKAQKTGQRKKDLPAQRGLIVDRYEEILARNLPKTKVIVDKYQARDANVASYAVALQILESRQDFEEASPERKSKMIRQQRRKVIEQLDPQEIIERHLAKAIEIMAETLGSTKGSLRQKIEGTRRMDVVIAQNVSEDVSDLLQQRLKAARIQGIRLEKKMRRWYSSPNLASHLVGYVNHEGKGCSGIEQQMNVELRGINGFQVIKRDRRGMVIPAHRAPMKPPVSGFNVQLTIDMGLQAVVEEELDLAMEDSEAHRGCIIILQPDTGEVLAMASRPHYNLNVRENVVAAGMNYAVQAVYEPGSTFKVVATAGALNEGLVNPRTRIFCHHGKLKEKRFSVPDHHPYGWLSFEEVLAKSSNIGTYQIARQLGQKKFYRYVDRFGFGQKCGVELPFEGKGLVHKTSNAVDFSRATYGYALNVTPLQVASAYGAIANGGVLIKPSLLKKVVANDGTVVKSFEKYQGERILKKVTAKRMRKALAKVVSPRGTAKLAAVPGYEVAGKTGTAKKHNPKRGGYLDGRYVVSFAGMMPVDKPEFVCVVVIDDPQTTKVKRYGGTLAAPVFSRVASRIASHLNLSPSRAIPASIASNQP